MDRDSSSAVNEIEPRKTVTDGGAEAVAWAEGKIMNRVMASCSWAPGVVDPIALYNLMTHKPLRSPAPLTLLATAGLGMPAEVKSRERQMVQEKSDRGVVPMKPGNAGGGKAATPARRSRQAPPGLRAGPAVTLPTSQHGEAVRALAGSRMRERRSSGSERGDSAIDRSTTTTRHRTSQTCGRAKQA